MTSDQVERAAIDHAAVARHQSSGAAFFVLFVALVVVALWTGVAAATHRQLPWVALLIGLAVGSTLRLAGTESQMGTRVLAVIFTVLASMAGCFASACLAQDMSPLMVLAHWGPVGQELLDRHVFTSQSMALYAGAAFLAMFAPVAWRSVHRAR